MAINTYNELQEQNMPHYYVAVLEKQIAEREPILNIKRRREEDRRLREIYNF